MDLVYAGLCRRFGFDRVVDYPAHAKHRRGRPVLTGDPERDYGLERGSLCYVSGCEATPAHSLQEVASMALAGEFDYVFLDETDEAFVRFISVFATGHRRTRVVVVAGHDRFRGDPAAVQMRFGQRLAAMFIDDWLPQYDGLPRTHLMNLSINFDHLWTSDRRDEFLADKRYDVCFVGYNSHPVRKLVVDHVRMRWGHLNNHIVLEERPDTFSDFVRHDRLFETMARSRVCLNLPGASTGGRALRFYETPYVGSFMLSARFPAKLIDPPEEDRHCAFFDSLAELDRNIGWALEEELTREMMAAECHDLFLRKHSVDARMDYVFNILEG
jgi:hypothetical protein